LVLGLGRGVAPAARRARHRRELRQPFGERRIGDRRRDLSLPEIEKPPGEVVEVGRVSHGETIREAEAHANAARDRTALSLCLQCSNG
jgi:hypothetical protein